MTAKKRILYILTAAVLCSAGLAACGNGAPDSTADTTAPAVTSAESSEISAPEPEPLPQTDEEWHKAMIDKSLTSFGNVTKMQEKLKAAQNGEPLNISYLGGSITEGMTVAPAYPEKCWAYLTYEHIREKFGAEGGDNVTYNNAGIAGTPSKLGVLRLDRDIMPHDPDICFVEFAVNDGGDGEYQMAYESIIRRLIENDVAVVLVFSVTENGHSCQEYMQKQGEYYGLPMISYRDALKFMFDNGKMQWSDFSDDQSHPNEYGHELVAEMINNYFDKVTEQSAEPYTCPEQPLTEIRPYGAHLYDNTNLTPVDTADWETGTSTAHFTDGWIHKVSAASNDPIKFRFTGKFVYMLYHEVSGGNYGKAHIKVMQDREVYDEFDFDPVDPKGWGNCQVKLIGMSPVNCEYDIEISMAEGDEKKAFAVLGFGYTKDE